MSHRLRRSALLFALIPLLALVACHQEFGTAGHGGPASGPGRATLVEIRTAEHPGFDRVVFQFTGPVPAYFAEYVPASALSGPSGQPVVPQGSYYLRVRFTDADVASNAPVRSTPLLSEVRDIRRVEAFEGVVVYAVGVRSRNAFRDFALTSPSRMVLDVQR